ncbi:RES family NAD+ phosphorylase [Faecalicoccus pleomorphus]|uniref:RES family NAD+ phosphorylase n=1 Tax=Faecalicoccus pleomorphus TaxID=1323 RepID=UPI00232D3255|nr:RES family NAD+ phosphorylase [Faecalicoccus pleomorphus]MDB7989944.1 RES family NAD+ phosphorylase [Faecalicoccus pleomorphus]MDB7994437.1 RES family NAD+ phosphorylase [Faecalicoccus pleomorphus]
MRCCERCFKDPEIKAIIRGNNTRGNCDFCHSNNVFICNLENNEYLKDNFESLLDVYTPIDEMEHTYPKEKADLIKNILCTQWSIFNLDTDAVYKFLVSLLPEKYSEQPTLFDNPIGISGTVDEEYMSRYSILGTYQWEDFVKEIKEKNRFHTNIINKDNLKTILLSTCKQYKAGSIFYRARICHDKQGFDEKDMGAPKAPNVSAGRANPEGISCLYLADSIDTTFHEIRAGVFDYVTIGTFRLLKDIEVINLAAIDKISPFQEIDCSLLAINLPHLRKIEYEISKPLRRHDSLLDYLPTQYISDYIKSIGFAGIEYKSTMCKLGVNFAIFNEKLFECIDTKSYDIDSLTYGYSGVE